MDKEVVKPSIWHRTIDGTKLCLARRSKGFSQEQFAAAAGWSRQYQSQLEAPDLHEVHIHTATIIQTILDSNLPIEQLIQKQAQAIQVTIRPHQ